MVLKTPDLQEPNVFAWTGKNRRKQYQTLSPQARSAV